MEYYLTVKRNEAFIYATRVIIRSLISQSQEIKYCVILLTSTTCTSEFTDPESTAKHWWLGKKMSPCLTGVKFQFGARMILGGQKRVTVESAPGTSQSFEWGLRL